MKTLTPTTLALVCVAGLLVRAVAQDAPPPATTNQTATATPEVAPAVVTAPATAAPQETPAAAPATTAPAAAEAAPSNADLLKMIQALQQQNDLLKQMLERQNTSTQTASPGGEMPNRGPRDFQMRGGRGGRNRFQDQSAGEDLTSLFPTTTTLATNLPATTDTNATIELNFRGAPLEQVLNHLSVAAGFVIALETSISRTATVDVWSERKVTPREAVNALDAALRKNGLAAIEENNVLTVLSTGNSRHPNIPVVNVGFTNAVPMSERIVTAIIPMRYIGAQEVMQNLYQILPSSSQISANVTGNSLVLTDTLSVVHRAVSLVRALDNPVASGTKTEIIFLNYADAPTMANIVQSLYSAQGRGGFGGGFGGGNLGNLLQNFRGGGFGGFGGGGFGGGGFGGGGGRGGRGGRGG